MNSTIAKLADEFEKMEKTIASQKKMIETLMPTGYVDTDTVKLHLNSVYGVMFGGRPSPKRCKLEDCSWDEINMYSSFGLADKMFEVGDTKKFRLADGSYLTARIIGFNHDYARDGSLVHITFETVETLDGDIPMNEKSTNEGGWDASYAVWFGGTENAGVVTPDGSNGKFSFDGELSVYPVGGGVNEVVNMNITIAPSTPITFSAT